MVATEDYKVIDRATRLRLAVAQGLTEIPVRVVRGLPDPQLRAVAINLNIHRQHLSRSERRKRIVADLKAEPDPFVNFSAARGGHRLLVAVDFFYQRQVAVAWSCPGGDPPSPEVRGQVFELLGLRSPAAVVEDAVRDAGGGGSWWGLDLLLPDPSGDVTDGHGA